MVNVVHIVGLNTENALKQVENNSFPLVRNIQMSMAFKFKKQCEKWKSYYAYHLHKKKPILLKKY